MRALVSICIFFGSLVMTFVSQAQAPSGIPYQAVARNADGSAMSNAAVSLLFQIHTVTANGAVVYEESHNLTSNAQGLVTCTLGGGASMIGLFSEINWSTNKFLQVTMNGIDLGTTQLLSVPYALYSSRSQSADCVQLSVSMMGDTLYSGNCSFVIVPGISGANYISGCTDPLACNYNANAVINSGACSYTGAACDDENNSTINDQITLDCVCAGTNTNIGQPGSVVLPANGTCLSENISVTGCGGETTVESDGVIYDLVEIGGQCWFADNLSADQYRNGDLIATDLSNAAWAATTSGAFAHFNNNVANDATYGKLYNWYAVNDARGICPAGWHVPSDCEWMFLENSLGMPVAEQEAYGWRGEADNVGGQLKTTNLWQAPNAGATNSSGFSAVPGGYRSSAGAFLELNASGFYWTSSEYDPTSGWFRKMFSAYPNSNRYGTSKKSGFSVRCLKD
jgi:uncharacterized protein (TIGR02145 family)